MRQQRTESFNIHVSVHGYHRFVVKPSPNSISYPVENSRTFKISRCLLLFSSKISTNKNRFVTTATSVEPRKGLSREYEKLGEFCSKSSMQALLNAAGHSCFIFRAGNPGEHFNFRSRFQSKPIKAIRINWKILCLQSPSILAI